MQISKDSFYIINMESFRVCLKVYMRKTQNKIWGLLKVKYKSDMIKYRDLVMLRV